MTHRQATQARLRRLVGDGKSGGGINLSLLFATLLDRLQDDGHLTTDTALNSIEIPLGNQFSRIQHLYGRTGDGADGLRQFILDCLAQLDEQQLTTQTGDSWIPGPAFALGKRLLVIGTFEGRRIDVGHTVLPRGEREQANEKRDWPSRIREDITRLAQLLQPTAIGLRPIRQDAVDHIRDSVERWGLQPEFPILRDQHGRIISGRHRLEVARQLGIKWPEKRITVRNDREALEIAMAANRSRPWAPADFERLASSGVGSTHRETVRRLVQLALLENANRSNVTIGRLVECDDKTVGRVRRELEETSEIPRFLFKGGRGVNTDRREATSRPPGGQMKVIVELLKERDGLTAQEVEKLTGMAHQSVSANLTNGVKSGYLVRASSRRPTVYRVSDDYLDSAPAIEPTQPHQYSDDSGNHTIELDDHRESPDPYAQLARLADLRDRGIITIDDFEVKKEDLLSRI